MATLPRWWKTFTRNRPSPVFETAKSISSSLVNSSSCCSLMSSIAAWRIILGVSSSLLTGMILPSILIFTGEWGLKNRSEARFSTIRLKSGWTFMGASSVMLSAMVLPGCSG
jgi:hypothetical protein